ncbi:MAG: tetratricopeptide repeat protein, partial [Sandaracinaceae bacterium]|nr:tetratricopeptide repeat protein [Sandaracinaceae bacterium]
MIEETSFAPAYASYRAAAEASPDLLAAVSGARRTADDPRERLAWLEREVALRDPSDRPFLLVEKARALDASGAEPATRVAAWEEARLASPDDDAALEGLLRALIAEGDRPALARHHARLARGVSRELAAAHLVVRGRILEGLGEGAEAAVAYREALALSDVPGPAREGLVRVLRRLRGFGELRALLIEDGDRAAERAARVRRFYEAARLSDDRLEDPAAAVSLLRRAHADAGDDPALDARVIEELCRLLEEQGDTHGAAAARRARIAYERLPAMRALEERRLARELEALSDLSGAVEAWERARALEPLDDLSRTTLDRLLATLGRDELRLALWIDEAKRAKDAVASAQAYVRAAAIADGALARPDEALRLLGAAWATRPGDEDALDAQTRILGRAREIRDAASVEKAVDLLEHASDLTTDVALRVAHLERAAQLAEDVDFDRAVALWERALALSPTRRFALAGLTRALHRAGAHAALARVLSREAEQTTDLEHATALRVRAAEVYQRDARDLERAVATLRRVLELKPDHQGALQLLLSCHEEAGRAEDARAVLRTLLTLRPDDAVLLLAEIAEVSRRQGDLAGCIEALEAILARVPGHEVATIDLARALRRAGRFREAAERTLDPVLAGELFEGRVGDDARAEELFLRAGDADGERRVHERRPRLLPELGAGLAGGLERLSVALREGHLSTVLAECFPAIDDARARVRGFEMRFALAPDVEAARALVADRGARERLLRSPEDAAFAWSILGESERSTVWASSLARALLLERAEALASARAALVLDGASPTAIARVIELSTALGDREAMLLGHRRAADIASEREARVQHLLAAAEAARAIAPDDAVALIDAALAEDPESLAAATAATQLLIGADAGKLAELLARAAFAANRQDRVVALSREAAALKEALGDPARACALLDRARAVDPNNVAVLVELGEALRTREAWGESARVLELAVGLGSESQ